MSTPPLGIEQQLAMAASRSRQLLYEAEIDNHGVTLNLRRLVTKGSSRRDLFGDLKVKSPDAQWLVVPTQFQINFGELIRILDVNDSIGAQSNRSMDIGPDTQFTAMVKLAAVVNIGDQVDIPYNVIGMQSSSALGITCQIREVVVASHMYPYSKKCVMFVMP